MHTYTCTYRGLGPSAWQQTESQLVAVCLESAKQLRRKYHAQGIDALVTVEKSDKKRYLVMVRVTINSRTE